MEQVVVNHPTLGLSLVIAERDLGGRKAKDILCALDQQIYMVLDEFLAPSNLRFPLSSKQVKAARTRYERDHQPTIEISNEPVGPNEIEIELVP